MKKQNWQQVESTQIKQIAHDAATQTLYVQFRPGTVYLYAAFPLTKFTQFQAADSAGKFLNAEIKGTYPFAKIENESELAALGIDMKLAGIKIAEPKFKFGHEVDVKRPGEPLHGRVIGIFQLDGFIFYNVIDRDGAVYENFQEDKLS